MSYSLIYEGIPRVDRLVIEESSIFSSIVFVPGNLQFWNGAFYKAGLAIIKGNIPEIGFATTAVGWCGLNEARVFPIVLPFERLRIEYVKSRNPLNLKIKILGSREVYIPGIQGEDFLIL